MGRRYDTVSLLTDYGTADEFAGVLRSVLRSLAPEVVVIDITHEVPPHDVRAGSLALLRASQYLAPGVVVAVVDPGVGTDRRAIAVEVGDGMSVLLGPDNGLLAPTVSMCGGAGRVVQLTNPAYLLEAPGATFAGRDVFVPAAAHLCNGVDLLELGPEVDAITLYPGVVPLTRQEDDGLHAEVLWVDRFGNAQLNVDPEEVAGLGARIVVSSGDTVRVAQRATAFAQLGTGQLGLVVDSYGLLCLALYRAHAADALGIGPGAPVLLKEPRRSGAESVGGKIDRRVADPDRP